jgi:transposase
MSPEKWKEKHAGDPLFETPPWEEVPLEERLARKQSRIERLQQDKEYLKRDRDGWKERAIDFQKENEKLKNEIRRIQEEFEKLQSLMRRPLSPSWAKPKSPDPLVKPKKKGPHVGHKANVRTVPEVVDSEVILIPKRCPHCDHHLTTKPTHWHDHTQVELPPPQKVKVTRYRLAGRYCRHCAEVVYSQEVMARTKYGPFLRATISHWKFGLGLTLPKIQKLLQEQHGLTISTGQLSEILSQNAGRLHPYVDGIKSALKKEKAVFADETGWRKQSDNQWLWSFSSAKYSYYTIRKGRSKKVVRDVLGKTFNGILHSDFLGSYCQIKSMKQKCWAHVFRKVRELKDKYPAALVQAEIKLFEFKLGKLFARACRIRDDYQLKKKDPHRRIQYLERATLELVFSPWENGELQVLSNRIWRYRDELYTFILSPDAHTTNNAAEREIRPAVLMRKTSYCNRSSRGATAQAVSMSAIRTCDKQNIPWIQTAAEIFRCS